MYVLQIFSSHLVKTSFVVDRKLLASVIIIKFENKNRKHMTDMDDCGDFTITEHVCVYSANGTYNCRICGKERVDF